MPARRQCDLTFRKTRTNEKSFSHPEWGQYQYIPQSPFDHRVVTGVHGTPRRRYGVKRTQTLITQTAKVRFSLENYFWIKDHLNIG